MRQTIGMGLVAVLMRLGAAPAQDDPVRGTWRGTVTSPGAESPIVLTFFKKGDAYAGAATAFGESNAIPLKSVAVSGSRVSLAATAESKLGTVSLTGDLTVDGNSLKGPGTLALGAQLFQITLQLTRRPRQEVVQPQVEQRLEYFLGRWTFEYIGGEFPPLSQGARGGSVTFSREGDSNFLLGHVDGELAGKKYQEQWSIGFDPATQMLVFQERGPGGRELMSLANWRSPLAIAFMTRPLQAGARTYQLRRRISINSAVAFEVTEEFSVDGGPYRRLGNARFTKLP